MGDSMCVLLYICPHTALYVVLAGHLRLVISIDVSTCTYRGGQKKKEDELGVV